MTGADQMLPGGPTVWRRRRSWTTNELSTNYRAQSNRRGDDSKTPVAAGFKPAPTNQTTKTCNATAGPKNAPNILRIFPHPFTSEFKTPQHPLHTHPSMQLPPCANIESLITHSPTSLDWSPHLVC